MMRNSTAKTRNGATPRMSAQRTPASGLERPRDDAAPAEAGAALLGTTVSVLLDIGSDDRVPVLGDLGVGRGLINKCREHGLGVERRVRQLVEQVLRNGVLAGKIVESDRMAVAGEPQQLALVGVEVLFPELGRIEMRRVGRDRLDIDAGDDRI